MVSTHSSKVPESAARSVSPGEANRALVIVSLAVLLASSTWLSGSAAATPLRDAWGLTVSEQAWLTISVQLGFVIGTLVYAIFNLADAFSARYVFFVSAVLGAACNGAVALLDDALWPALGLRFATGVTLAGVYPVGMKIIASWFRTNLGWRLGVMVGALTLGTASPYLVRALGTAFSWQAPVIASSIAAAIGGVLVLIAIDDGPYLAKRAPFDAKMVWRIFEHKPFRYTAFGYFGHMWELYAFWALLGSYLELSFATDAQWQARVPMIAFVAIAVGALGCTVGGWVSRRVGERRVALLSLTISGSLCALSPWLFSLPPSVLVAVLIVWGLFVVADSPQFSALAARHCPPQYTGTALTAQNGIGFAITVVSLQLLSYAVGSDAGFLGEITWQYAFVLLLPGPVVGAFYMFRLGAMDT